MTYGHYQEEMCGALCDLLSVTGDDAGSDFGTQCRRAVLVSLRERVDHLRPPPKYRPWPVSGTPRVLAVWDQPIAHLRSLIEVMVANAPDTGSLSDLLQSEVTAPADVAWRAAARTAFLATCELTGAAEQPWLMRASARWPLVADIADTVEALAMIDVALGGPFSMLGRPDREAARRVLVAANAGRAARLAPQEVTADLASAGVKTSSQGIQMVRAWADVAVAQRRLAQILRPIRVDWDFRVPEDSPGLRVARGLAYGQALVSHRAGSRASELGLDALAESFEARLNRYRQLHASTARLVDGRSGRSPLALLQQGEVATWLRTAPAPRLSSAQLHDLDVASHEVGVQLGRALRLEAMTRRTIQVLAERNEGVPAPSPITNTRHRFVRACNDLAHAEAPVPALNTAFASERVQRRALRTALDLAPLAGGQVRR